MFDLIEKILENDDELFAVGGITGEKVQELERKLNVTFTKSYKEFLMKFGLLIGYGIEILGCGQSGEASVVKETVRYRQFGLPTQFVQGNFVPGNQIFPGSLPETLYRDCSIAACPAIKTTTTFRAAVAGLNSFSALQLDLIMNISA